LNRLTKLKTNDKRNYFENQLKYQGDAKKNVGFVSAVTTFKNKTTNHFFGTLGT